MRVTDRAPALLAAALLLPSGAAADVVFEIAPIVFSGDVAPDMGGASYDSLGSSFTSPVVSEDGIVGFQASFAGVGRGLFAVTPQAGALVALESGPANGIGGTFTFMPNDGGISFDSTNQLVFEAAHSGLGSAGFAASPGLVTPLVSPGDPLHEPAITVSYIASMASREGTLLFEAGSTAGVGLFHRKDGVTSKIVLRGEPVPGVPGRTFEFLVEGTRLAGPDATGRIAFGNWDGETSGVFLWSAGTLTRVAYSGDPAPGTGAGFDILGHTPYLNDAGIMVFYARLDDPDQTAGIFRFDGATIEPLVLSGQVAPGTGGRRYDTPSPRGLDDTGALLFLASLEDGGGPAGEGLFRLAGDAVDLLVLTGDVAPGSGGATYTDLSLPVTPEGALSPSGRFFAFRAVLSDGRSGFFRGSFTASVPALPPADLLALGLALAAAARIALAAPGRIRRGGGPR